MPVIKVGKESPEMECEECNHVQFSVTLEPSYKDPELAKQLGSKAMTLKHCPFCGGRLISAT